MKPGKLILTALIFTVALGSFILLIMPSRSGRLFAVQTSGYKGLRADLDMDIHVPTDNLNPGDTKTAIMSVSVDGLTDIGVSSIPVYFVSEISENSPGMGGGNIDDKLELVLLLEKGEEEYMLPYRSFSELSIASPIFIGNFVADEKATLRFTVHLPGEGTGNEHQGASMTVEFTVLTSLPAPDSVSDEEIITVPDEEIPAAMPAAGGLPPAVVIASGMLIAFIGLVLFSSKRKRYDNKD